MKTFIFKIILFALIFGISAYAIFMSADGYYDPFYIRFTTPKQKNLILGTSRAAEGLQPAVFKKILGLSFFNYSFTVDHSPFGPTYLESIKKKIDGKSKGGIFIISVNPWSISSRSDNPNDISKFRELDRCLDNTRIVCMNPNPFYIFNNASGQYYKLLIKPEAPLVLHDDGWLEVSLSMDQPLVEKRARELLDLYRNESLFVYKFSSKRLAYLEKTVNYLNNYGRVYMVRLPMGQKMLEIEKYFMPDFDSKLQAIKELTAGYLDMTENSSGLRYTDCNHLHKDSGRQVSATIAYWILNKENLRNAAQSTL